MLSETERSDEDHSVVAHAGLQRRNERDEDLPSRLEEGTRLELPLTLITPD